MKIEDFANVTEIRDTQIDGVTGWRWPTIDTGAWTGPMSDWREFRAVYAKMWPRRTVVQAGGNCGMYPMLMSQLFDRVYTFEPDAVNFFCLVNNCQSNRIFKFNAALGERQGFVSLQRNTMSNTGSFSIDPNAAALEMIPIMTIDQFGFGDVDLIALDIEMYEPFALRGALDTIARCRPIVQGENCSDSRVGDILRPLDYEPRMSVCADTFWVPKERAGFDN